MVLILLTLHPHAAMFQRDFWQNAPAHRRRANDVLLPTEPGSRRSEEPAGSAMALSSKPLPRQLAEPLAKTLRVLIHVRTMPLIPLPQSWTQLC